MQMKAFYKRSIVYGMGLILGFGVPFWLYRHAPVEAYHWLGFLRVGASSAGHVYGLGFLMGILLMVPWVVEWTLYLRRHGRSSRGHEDDD